MNLGNFKVSFLFRGSIKKETKQGVVSPVYLRIEHYKKRKDFSTRIYCRKEEWNKTFKRLEGKSANSIRSNRQLDIWKEKAEQIYYDALRTGRDLSLDEFYQEMTNSREAIGLLKVFADRIAEMQQNIRKPDQPKGIGFTVSTITTYVCALKHINGFLKHGKRSDIPLKNIDKAFFIQFENYLLAKMKRNSANKYLRKLKAVLNNAQDKKLLGQQFSISDFKIKDEEVTKVYLTEEELCKISTKKLRIERLRVVRDLFCFQCYTGLAFADIKALTPACIFKEKEQLFISKNRVKTNIAANIPLLPPAIELLEKYRSYQEMGICFPVPSNQKFNAYLQEIADLCEIDKPITTHIGRHTFASFLLNNGMSEEFIAKIMGLSSTKHVKVYAKMKKESLHRELTSVFERSTLR